MNIKYNLFFLWSNRFLKRIKRFFVHKSTRKPWVFSRTACLGTDVFDAVFPSLERFNLQKARVDFLSFQMDKFKVSTPSPSLYKMLKRKYVWRLIESQSDTRWLSNSRPEFCVMDSYSELTDQHFVQTKNAVDFYCNFSDLDPGPINSGKIKALGLIEIENIQDCYKTFFENIWLKWPDVKIFFLHFPSSLENRKVFQERAVKILEVIEEIANSSPNLISISVPEELVERDPSPDYDLADFPYHYSPNTYTMFETKLSNKICEEIPKYKHISRRHI